MKQFLYTWKVTEQRKPHIDTAAKWERILTEFGAFEGLFMNAA